jgi:hypothetical protein
MTCLQGYIYSKRSEINDPEKLGAKLDEEDKRAALDAVKEGIDWLDENKDADKESCQDKLKVRSSDGSWLCLAHGFLAVIQEIQGIIEPIISKAYQRSGTFSKAKLSSKHGCFFV